MFSFGPHPLPVVEENLWAQDFMRQVPFMFFDHECQSIVVGILPGKVVE